MSGKTQKSVRTENRRMPVVLTAAVLAFSTAKCGPEGPMGNNSDVDSGVVPRDANPSTDSRVNSDSGQSQCSFRNVGMAPSMLGARVPLVADLRNDEFFSFSYPSPTGGSPRTLNLHLRTYTRDEFVRVNPNIARDVETLPPGSSPSMFAVMTAVNSTTCRPIVETSSLGTSRTVSETFESRDSFGSVRSVLFPGGMMVYPNSINSQGAQFFIMTDYSRGWGIPTNHRVPATPSTTVACSDFMISPVGPMSLVIGQDTINSYLVSMTRAGMLPMPKEIEAFSDSSSSLHYALVGSGPSSVFYQLSVRWLRSENQLSVSIYERE